MAAVLFYKGNFWKIKGGVLSLYGFLAAPELLQNIENVMYL